MKLYEAMFVMDVQASPDNQAMEAEIARIFGRAEAETLICRRWEDRRLAYEIDARKRGSYWLTYFKCPSDKVVGIERDVQLSEKVLRVLVLSIEAVPQSEFSQPPAQAEGQPSREPDNQQAPVEAMADVADQVVQSDESQA